MVILVEQVIDLLGLQELKKKRKTKREEVYKDRLCIILHMMGAASEMPNPSLKWQDLAIQKLNHHGNLIFGETRKNIGISTREPGRIHYGAFPPLFQNWRKCAHSPD